MITRPEITITIDVDWAPEEMIEDTLLLLEEYNVTATFFCTHKSPILLEQKTHELAIHPNFVSIMNQTASFSAEEEVDRLLNIYPEAIGVRAHGLVQSSALMQLYIDKGLKYDSNVCLPYQPLEKYIYDNYNGFKRNVYNFEDDIVYKTNKPLRFDINDFKSSKIIICDFHPFLIYNNISSNEEYEDLKKDYMNVNILGSKRNLKKTGVRMMFKKTLKQTDNQSKKLKDNIL